MDAALFGLVSPSPGGDPADLAERLCALLAGGADLAARDENGATALHHAVEAPDGPDNDLLPSLKAVRLLLESGADVHARDRNEMTPAGRAVLLNDDMPTAAVDRSVQVLALLVAHGARLDGPAGRSEGGSFAHHSCTAPEIYAFLLDHGAPTALVDERGDTPLHATVDSRRPRLVELLLRHGVDTDAVNYLGQTPLGVAQHLSQYTETQQQARSEIISLLEAAGARPHVSYPAVVDGPLPIDMAEVRQLAEAMRAEGRDDPDLQECLTEDYDSYQHLVDERLATSASDPDVLVELCRRALGDTGATRTMAGDQKLRQPFFHHGDLIVDGNLTVLTRFLVTGDVTVTGCLSDAGPDSRISVGGNLRARGVHTDGEIYIGGALEAEVVYGYYNDFTLTADVIRARLVIEDDHGIAADIDAEHHFDLWADEEEDGAGAQERLRAILVEEVFKQDEDEDEMTLDQSTLFELLQQGGPVFRDGDA